MIPTTNFEPTQGLNVRGEIGWHTHGTGDLKDTDIDLAIIIESEEPIDPDYTTMVLWGIPLQEAGIVVEKLEYEVAYFEYRPAGTNREKTWILEQTLVQGINESNTDIFTGSGNDFNSIVEQ